MFNFSGRQALMKASICLITVFAQLEVLRAMEDVSFKAKNDGTIQKYIQILPEKFNKSNQVDIIIGLHGHGSDRWQFAKHNRGECKAFRDIANKYKMIAICPDYRARTSWMGPAAEADLLQIIKELKNKFKVGKIYLCGGSMGGTATLTFTALHPELIAGAAALNGHANLLEYTNFQDAIAESFGGNKKDAFAEYKKRSAEYWPEKFTMPVAFTTGGMDTSVPPASVHRLAKIIKIFNPKVLLIHRPQTGHSTDYADSLAAYEFMITGKADVPAANNKPQPAKQLTITDSKDGFLFASLKPAAIGKGSYSLGLKFSTSEPGYISSFAFYKPENESGNHKFTLWDAGGRVLYSCDAAPSDTSGWSVTKLQKPIHIDENSVYTLSYVSNKSYNSTLNFFKVPTIKGKVKALKGVYSKDISGKTMPEKTYKNLNYFVDFSFIPDSEAEKN